MSDAIVCFPSHFCTTKLYSSMFDDAEYLWVNLLDDAKHVWVLCWMMLKDSEGRLR